MSISYNRTKVELKLTLRAAARRSHVPYNRTKVELKRFSRPSTHSWSVRL